MPDDWTLDRLVSFALGLGTFERLDPATIQELGEGLAFLTQEQVAQQQRWADIVQKLEATNDTQAHTIQLQAATIERQRDALERCRPGVVLLSEEEDAP